MHAGVNRMKTWVLIAALGGLFVLIGGVARRDRAALWIALAIGLVFNLSMYWFSDKIAIATTRSKPVTEQEYPQLYRIVRELTQLEHADAPHLRLRHGAAQRVRDRPQPAPRGRRRDEGHPADRGRARAARRAGPRAVARARTATS